MVLAALVFSLLVTQLSVNAILQDDKYYQDNTWPKVLALGISCCLLVVGFALWRRKHKPLSTAHQWGLAAGGILTRLHLEGFAQLRCERGSTSRRNLRGGWDVHNGPELAKVLHWLWTEGHSSNCLAICREVRGQCGVGVDIKARDVGAIQSFVLAHLGELETSRLLGWDLSRLVMVARWGFTAGYLNEGEAWEWIFRAARKIQDSYSSWEDFGKDFLLGFEFWLCASGTSRELDLMPAYQWLVDSPTSPWRRLPWSTVLLTPDLNPDKRL
jgi:hypothetical protein